MNLPAIDPAIGQWWQRTPLGCFVSRHRVLLLEGFPWLVIALVVLGLALALGGTDAFGIVLGLEGVALGVWFAFLTDRATSDVRGLTETALALAELERLEPVKQAVKPLALKAWEHERAHPGTPFLLTAAERADHYQRIDAGLRRSYGLKLPGCMFLTTFLSSLNDAMFAQGLEGVPDPDTFDFRPLIDEADGEIRRIGFTRSRFLRPWEKDQTRIPP